MLLTEKVTVTLNSINIKYYDSKGYFIPRYQEPGRNRFKVKKGTTIEVLVKDLQPSSAIKVLMRCDDPNCHCGPNGGPAENWVNYFNVNESGEYICKICTNHDPVRLKKLIEFNTGKHRSAETKRKIGLANLNRIMSDEARHKISISHSGTNNYGWDPNKTDEERMRHHSWPGIGKWVKQIKNRDDHKCQICGSSEHLHAHHINNFDDFPEQRIDPKNGITLCFTCHQGKNNSIHSLYGKKTTRKDWQLFLRRNRRKIKS